MSDFVKKEKYQGVFEGSEVSFNREWGGHRFTDEECERLCNGEEIEIHDLVSKNTGKKYGVTGRLTHQTYKDHPFVGFERTGFASSDSVPSAFCGHTFTDDEVVALESGMELSLKGLVSKKGKVFDATLKFGEKEDGTKGIILC